MGRVIVFGFGGLVLIGLIVLAVIFIPGAARAGFALLTFKRKEKKKSEEIKDSPAAKPDSSSGNSDYGRWV